MSVVSVTVTFCVAVPVFDDFIISFFVAGPNTTLPIYVFASIRRGITPEVNAIGTMVLAVSLILLVAAQFLLRARTRR